MTTPQVAKLIKIGSQQVIILPAEIQLTGETVYVHQEGEQLILSSASLSKWQEFFDNPDRPTDDFMQERVDSLPQLRKWFGD